MLIAGIIFPSSGIGSAMFTLEMEDRAVSLKTGQAMLEPVNVKMRAANRDATPVRVVIFQVSPPGDPFLVPSK